MTDAFFVLALAFLLVHEMDAIRCSEWRVFPLTSRMEDDRGYAVFTALHVPLYAAVLLPLLGGDESHGLKVALDVFFIVHVGLHVLFIGHPQYRFTTAFSWALILGAGLLGGIDLLVRL